MSGEPFGDADPEDGWDASDTLAEQLRNIDHRLQWIADHGLDTARLHRIRHDLREVVARIVIAVAVLDASAPDAHPRTRDLDPD